MHISWGGKEGSPCCEHSRPPSPAALTCSPGPTSLCAPLCRPPEPALQLRQLPARRGRGAPPRAERSAFSAVGTKNRSVSSKSQERTSTLPSSRERTAPVNFSLAELQAAERASVCLRLQHAAAPGNLLKALRVLESTWAPAHTDGC